ncbi:hemopexin [Syngnathoides biaculeatus]|uniref:hemopexin n=1 Tax=Syngnathoides biaculeatus TaxID=300417 RepID=UPI002ADE4B1C|nr:hemopexin [Syngnathoides biaculeatus]
MEFLIKQATMKILLATVLCLCLASVWADHHGILPAIPDRCLGLELDAVTVSEEDVPLFIKGHYLFKGFHGKAELLNGSFPELFHHDEPHHIDAAFRMHFENSSDHDHIFIFVGHLVYSFYKHRLEIGFPKNISEVFPGIPDHLDAAIGCPKPDCDANDVIFFKEHKIYHFNVDNRTVVDKDFETMPNCTAAFRYMEHYYCFHGHQFSKFDPKTGEVHGRYPKEARDFFMRCSNYSAETDIVERERCSHVHLDAITSDDDGNLYAFRGHHFLQRDGNNDTVKADAIEASFKELHSEVDAVFSYEDHLYMLKDNDLYLYKISEPHTLLDGYPKTVKEVLGLEGPIDAAFVCQDEHIAHIIKGDHIYDVDLKASPHVAANERPLSLIKKVDAAMCDPHGVRVIVGNHFYHFDTLKLFVGARSIPEQHRVSIDLFGCDH